MRRAERNRAADLHADSVCPNALAIEEGRKFVGGGSRRQCLRSDGRPKYWYETKSAAKEASAKYFDVYPCPSGRGWHLGRSR